MSQTKQLQISKSILTSKTNVHIPELSVQKQYELESKIKSYNMLFDVQYQLLQQTYTMSITQIFESKIFSNSDLRST